MYQEFVTRSVGVTVKLSPIYLSSTKMMSKLIWGNTNFMKAPRHITLLRFSS